MQIRIILAAMVSIAMLSSSVRAEPTTVLRVRTAPVAAIPVATAKQTTGIVAAYREATVAAEVGGKIIARHMEPGLVAQANEVVVVIDTQRLSLALQSAQAQARARQVDRDHARHEHTRGKRLAQQRVISQDRLDDLAFAANRAQAQYEAAKVAVASAQRNLDDAQVRIPFSGQIEQIHVQVGDYVNPGQPIVTLTDFDAARLLVGVTGRETQTIEAGSSAQVVFDDLGGASFAARVTSIGRIKDVRSGTYPVEFALQVPPNNRLRQGMVGTVVWSQALTESNALSIPSGALLRRDGQLSAYVLEGDTVRLVKLRIGNSDGQRVEVLDGLSAGDEVVVEGLFALRDGARVTTSQ